MRMNFGGTWIYAVLEVHHTVVLVLDLSVLFYLLQGCPTSEMLFLFHVLLKTQHFNSYSSPDFFYLYERNFMKC